MIKDLSIVVTAYNEEGNIHNTLTDITRELNKLRIDYEIIAVDNGSSDRTGEIIKSFPSKRVKHVRVPLNIGYGNGVLQGMKTANAKFIGYMWGDNEISAKHLPELYMHLKNGNADLAKIARTTRWYGLYRKIQSKSYIALTRMMFGNVSNDVNGCPKIMRAEHLKKMNLSSEKWFLDTEIMVKAKKLGMRVVEVDAEYKKRQGGKSNVKMTTALSFMKSLIGFKLKTMREN